MSFSVAYGACSVGVYTQKCNRKCILTVFYREALNKCDNCSRVVRS